nr:MAG TPA: hypothetical protein [Caudoviricetes sp.]
MTLFNSVLAGSHGEILNFQVAKNLLLIINQFQLLAVA